MTALHQAIEYSALGWVKPELDETLRLVRVEVEGFAEDPSDTSRMRVSADLMHQVQGTLRMVELYAPAMVAEEMEHLSAALQNGQISDRDTACSALMRGVVQLPDYLERLQSGHKEISIVLLPLLNELRAARGEVGLSESVLFNPDLNRDLPVSLPRATQTSDAARASEAAPHLMRLRDAMQAWPEQGKPADIEGLRLSAEALLSRTSDESQRRMFWVASMVADAMSANALTLNTGLRQAFASVEREARSLFGQGSFDAQRADAPLEPTRQLLYHVANAESSHPTLGELRKIFELDTLKPTESELDHARGSVAGRNRSLLDTVSAAVKEDLLRVKDELDLYLRTGKTDPTELKPQAERLQSVSDTLGMLGLGLARTLVQQQRDSMQEIVEGKRKADESALLEVAGALLYVDASLDDQVARLASGDGADTAEDLAGAEARKVLDIVIREAITNFAAARQAFEAFVETSWTHAELALVPKLLQDVSGALIILELPLPAQYLDGVRMYVEVELLERHRIPNSRQIDTFVDAVASIEYFLEAVREQRSNRDDILDITRHSLESLGYWPVPAERAPAPEPALAVAPPVQPMVAETVAADELPVEEIVVVEVPVFEVPVFEAQEVEAPAAVVPVLDIVVSEEPPKAAETATTPPLLWARQFVRQQNAPVSSESQSSATPPVVEEAAAATPTPVAPVVVDIPLPTPSVAPIAAGFDVTSDDIDDEIREIFLEEFEEEIANLGQLLPPWKADPNNVERLQPVRRVFHTLKGSGRLVGAKTLGEFSWKIESMLNRVRDGLRPATAPVIAMVDQAYATLPQLHAALRGDGVVTVDLHAMEGFADRIASGEEVMPAMGAFALIVPAATAIEAVETVETISAEVPAATPVDDGIPVSVDMVLFEILQAEVGGHLATIDQWLDRARKAPAFADESLVRAIHTMNGAFAMTEVPAITDALTPAEGCARRLLASSNVASAEAVDAIGELASRVRATISALSQPGGRVPRCDVLAARFIALRDSLPEFNLAMTVDEPVEFDSAMVATGDAVELTDLDLSAYGNFDIEVSNPEPVYDVAVDSMPFDGTALDADTEAELAKLFSQDIGVPTALADSSTMAEMDSAGTVETDNAAHLLGLMESFEAERLEAERLEVERLEVERLEVERLEVERLEAERLEAERLEVERLEVERLEVERLEAERLEAERIEGERLEAERLEDERLEAELLEIERHAAEAFIDADVVHPAVETVAADAPAIELNAFEGFLIEEIEIEDMTGAVSAVESPTAEVSAPEVSVDTTASLASALPAVFADVVDPDMALDMEDLDSDLIDIFVEEGRDLLDHSDKLLVGLREAPEEREIIGGLQRDLHTLKGGARMAGIMALGELGHAMESLLEAVAEQRTMLASKDIVLLERGFDRLHTMVTRVGDRRAVAMPEALVSAFDARAQGRTVEFPSDAYVGKVVPAVLETPVASDSIDSEDFVIEELQSEFNEKIPAAEMPQLVEQTEVERTVSETLPSLRTFHSPAPTVPADVTYASGLKPLSSPIQSSTSTDDDAALRGGQEQVRVRAELLDRLVNYAGEVAIYRSRLEQQLGAFRAATAEMGQTNTRLRDQLRRLEIETEAQIIARYQRAGEQDESTFDPLELDRFSNLQQLSRALVETSTDLGSLQSTLDDLTQQYDTLLLQQSRVSSELQEGLMRTRMVPFDTVVPRLRRVLRQAATDTGKQVQLKLDGAQGELDRNVLERMTAPLEHMLRNSVAHGLESASERAKAGKSAEGTVTVAIRKEGSEVVLQISDDGKGLNRDAIRARGEARGLVRKELPLSNAQLDALIFEPGFSTAEEVTQLAGRGVGMDVVASEVRQLGGTIDIHTELGKGTIFTLRLPQTLAVTQAALVRIGEITFAVPIASVRGVGRIQREELAKGVEVYRYGNQEYVLHDLGKLLGHAPAKAEGQLQMPLLLTRSGDLHIAVSVDQIIGNREIVVKPIGPQVASIPGIFGATIMGDGSVVVILDVAPLVRRQSAVLAGLQEEQQAPIEQRAVPLVMVVDDSITMRKVTGRVLERNNFEVITAKDGLDALERMVDRVPDLMLLDIEMPRMDGYELATAMKADGRLANVPIIMITSRTGDKHRQRAMDIGVNRYLGKPYQENELMRNVFSLLEETESAMVRSDG